jgi:hypothetical protein
VKDAFLSNDAAASYLRRELAKRVEEEEEKFIVNFIFFYTLTQDRRI